MYSSVQKNSQLNLRSSIIAGQCSLASLAVNYYFTAILHSGDRVCMNLFVCACFVAAVMTWTGEH